MLNVVSPNRVDHPDQFHRLQEHFYNALGLVVPQSARKLCEPGTFVSVGNPQSEIVKHIDDHEIDLLIMGLRRNAHLGMQNRTFGAFPIIVEASCPVITVASGSVYALSHWVSVRKACTGNKTGRLILKFLIFDKVGLKQVIALLLSKMDRIEMHRNVGRTRLSTVCKY